MANFPVVADSNHSGSLVKLRLLITNVSLASHSGTEMYVRDLALGLLRRGHSVVAYSPHLGDLAAQLNNDSIPVVDCLGRITQPPDVIHGHHSLETMAALLHFPSVPAIFVCHDCSAWHDTAPRFPRIRQYVAVDHACRERLTMRDGISSEQVSVIHNGVDLQRFIPRGTLPKRPKRALIISNYADYKTVRPIREACIQAGITLDAVGSNLGGICQRPESLLREYDLVFAKGRCAWEALSVGAAVIVCDAKGIGPMVTTDELDNLSQWNFGRRLLTEPVQIDTVYHQLARYDAVDATNVHRHIRAMSDIERLLNQLITLYQDVIDEQKKSIPNASDESIATAELLHWWATTHRELTRQRAKRYLPSSITARWWRGAKKQIALHWPHLDRAAYWAQQRLNRAG